MLKKRGAKESRSYVQSRASAHFITLPTLSWQLKNFSSILDYNCKGSARNRNNRYYYIMACELSKLAYSKIILHAFKYPHTAINGVLLANEGSSNQVLKYVDAIPLFHNNLGLAPMLEVALMQVNNCLLLV